MCWDTTHGNPRIHEEPREPYRKGDRSATVGQTHLQGRTRRERKLEPSTRQNRTSGIRTSRVPGGHPRHDNRGTGKRHYQEGTIEQYRGKPDWTGGRAKEELFNGSDSDSWHQEKHYDLRWRLYHPENRYKTEQGGGRSRVFTGSKNIACDRESREDRGKMKWRDHTSRRRDEQHGQGRNNGDS